MNFSQKEAEKLVDIGAFSSQSIVWDGNTVIEGLRAIKHPKRHSPLEYLKMECGESVYIGDSIIQAPVRIGSNVTIGSYCHIGRNCTIGDNVVIDSTCKIPPNSVIKPGTHWTGSVWQRLMLRLGI